MGGKNWWGYEMNSNFGGLASWGPRKDLKEEEEKEYGTESPVQRKRRKEFKDSEACYYCLDIKST